MYLSSPATQETATTSAPPAGRKVGIRIFLGRAKLGVRRVKEWIFRGGASSRLIYSVGKRDSCEMRKLFGGHSVKK